MANWPPTNILSSKFTARDSTRSARPRTARPVAAKSLLLRAVYLGGSARRARSRRPTEVWLGSLSSSLHTPQESPKKKSIFQKLYVSKLKIKN